MATNSLPAGAEAGPSTFPITSWMTSDLSLENRKTRRRRKKRESQAGPSNSAEPTDPWDSSKDDSEESQGKENDSQKTSGSNTFGEDDFVAFNFLDAPEFAQDEEVVEEPLERAWDKGKARMQDVDSPSNAGRKRKAGEMDLNDGYVNKKQRMDASSRKAPWAWDVDWDSCHNVAQMLHREVDAFVKYISPTPVEDEVRSMIVSLVSGAVTQQYPDAQVLPFGSYETKLYLPIGDIDLVILSRSMAYSKIPNVLHSLANTVKRAGITDRVTIIAKAKVPIIKFITRHGRFSVDISINQSNGVAAGKIIKHFIREHPALRALVLIIKSFLSQRSMNEVFTGGLGSYSIVCLAISFLQMHPKIRRGEIDPEKNLGVLVMEFFELYGCYFNYREVGISLREGGTYYNKAQRGWLDYRNSGLLSIEDPGDPSNDISRGSYGIAKVRTTLAGAHGIMTAAAYLHAGYIAARREHRTVHLTLQKNPEDMSILASVMGVTQETINHRRVVQEVYDSRVLHRMLGIEPQVAVSLDVKQDGRSKSGAESHIAQESLKAAWNEADMEVMSEDGELLDEEEEESRYGAHHQPPKKRRKTGREKDTHTVYTTDDDDEDGDLRVSTITGGDDGVSEEEAEYDVDEPSSETKRSRTRSYWLSKAMAVGSS